MAAICYLRKLHQLLLWTAEMLPLHRSSQQAGSKAKAPADDEINEWSLKAEGCVLVFTLQKPFTNDFPAFPEAALEPCLSLHFSLLLGTLTCLMYRQNQWD